MEILEIYPWTVWEFLSYTDYTKKEKGEEHWQQ